MSASLGSPVHPLLPADTADARSLVEVDKTQLDLVAPSDDDSIVAPPSVDMASTEPARGYSDLAHIVRRRRSDATDVQPLLSPPTIVYGSLAKWEGYVTSVGHDGFEARLVAVDGAAEDMDVEFDKEEVDPGDRSLLVPGAVFYWDVGYEDGSSGRKRVSQLMFRRLPIRRVEDVDAALAKARHTSDEFAVAE